MAIKQTENVDQDPKVVHDSIVHDNDSADTELVIMTENEANEKLTRDLAFLHEKVEVMIMESGDPRDTTRLVDFSINGKRYYFMRGEWRTVPRFVLEAIARNREEAWRFSYKRNHDGTTSDTNHATQSLRHAYQWRDSNPAGQAWHQSIVNSVN